jgi:hypothetical protein
VLYPKIVAVVTGGGGGGVPPPPVPGRTTTGIDRPSMRCADVTSSGCVTVSTTCRSTSRVDRYDTRKSEAIPNGDSPNGPTPNPSTPVTPVATTPGGSTSITSLGWIAGFGASSNDTCDASPVRRANSAPAYSVASASVSRFADDRNTGTIPNGPAAVGWLTGSGPA